MDAAIEILYSEGCNSTADELSDIKKYTCSAAELLTSFTFKLKHFVLQNPDLKNDHLANLSNELTEFCYSIGLRIR